MAVVLLVNSSIKAVYRLWWL